MGWFSSLKISGESYLKLGASSKPGWGGLNFELTEEQEDIRSAVLEFAEKEFTDEVSNEVLEDFFKKQ